MRYFFAFPVPAGFDKDVAWQLSHAVFPQGLHWVAPHNYHLTLCFLGELPPDKLDDCIRKAETLSSQFAPIKIETHVITHYPQRDPDMLWVRFVRSTEFEAIYNACHQIFRIPIRFQGAHPHITLARYGRRRNITYRKQWEGYPILLHQFQLYRSARHNEDLVYEPVAAFELNG